MALKMRKTQTESADNNIFWTTMADLLLGLAIIFMTLFVLAMTGFTQQSLEQKKQQIEVNKELDVLKDTLNLALNHINIGGRIVVITFNSLEDRIVKNIFNSKSKVINNRYDLLNLENPDFSLVNKKVIVASSEELENNLRAKSAKLRAIERIK